MATRFRYFRLNFGQKGSAGPLLLGCVPAQAVGGLCLDATITEPEFTHLIPTVKLNNHSLEDSQGAREYGPRGQLASGHALSESALPLAFLGSGLYSHHLLTWLPFPSNELSFKTFHVVSL